MDSPQLPPAPALPSVAPSPILASISAVWDRFEMFFDSLGLMDGFLSPFIRGLLIFGVVSLPFWAFRPSIMFTKDGSPRPWLWIDPEPRDKPTVIPWYLPGGLLAIWTSLFI